MTSKTTALKTLELSLTNLLDRSKKEKQEFHYAVPSLWISDKSPLKREEFNPFSFYLGVLKKLHGATKKPRKTKSSSGGEWSKDAIVYNMFVRTTAAFDHDGNGTLDLPLNKAGFRETGTFLKAITMLPYIQRLGANTIHLLPITSIGKDGNKGNLGSPYAIRNAYELDENLSEPCLGLDVATQFKAFVEAAHHMGFRVVVEFVFRTAAKDADWVKEYPEWFYWIREDVEMRNSHEQDESRYGSPLFTKEELEHIHHEVRNHRFDSLLPPHPQYRNLFTHPPTSVEHNGERYTGSDAGGQRMKIPGAFADWPPDDNQPPWGDVTYLRMYNDPNFNYIAYNTIRMYDTGLAQPSKINRPLWDKIVGIIPYYQREYGIDGVMIDMGHALPMELKQEIVQAARELDGDFAFWDENFSITHRSREEGYNAVFGFLWIDEHHPSRMKVFCQRWEREGFPIPYFGTPENHNTPRAATRPGGLIYAKWSWVVNCFLPAIPFIHSGFELAETYPINTGLDFTQEQIRELPSERLALFSAAMYDWCREEQFTSYVSHIAGIREAFKDIVVDTRPETFTMINAVNEQILAFARTASPGKKRIAIVTNTNFFGVEVVGVRLETALKEVKDLVEKKRYLLHDGELSAQLNPGQCLLFEF